MGNCQLNWEHPELLSAIIQVDSLGGGGAISTFHIIPGQNGVNFTIRLNNTTTPLYGFMASYTVGTLLEQDMRSGIPDSLLPETTASRTPLRCQFCKWLRRCHRHHHHQRDWSTVRHFHEQAELSGEGTAGNRNRISYQHHRSIAGSGATVNILALTNGSACATMANRRLLSELSSPMA